ncbi:MAG: peptide ABC transporter permease [Bdellovibrio sp. CG12_big_fil_rev_8_21_14_0_65_39_13]|nr:MAG: peptide ABC transporter permease [Bdellovibrio sp. CG22_combo_CG10-13_8_21_14_all_39_27]PIQ58725.1 MAG: peptide ABC transporter permease [Bdellovibrio sp. CG12_big_fil_rev_8_21_14_0_65_39_13]PIR33100.1 MAG: peptide ABC transporter permease [Bdellovibrio sp. CG11_big_fil_rev_8_21_14_0_20_39_38]PJB53050.1 MAG: ABC transporter permease [Bdellovibrio sp. CG_4_9_14_3_um_filter_39_7]
MNTWTYIARRTLYVIPVILGVCFLIFVLFNVFSPDPAMIMLGKHATAKQMAELRAELGLDKPFFIQYLDIVKASFTFDFGRSWSTKQEIFQMIKQGAIPSLTVTLPGFLLSTLISIAISLLVAFYRGKMIDKAVVFFCVAGMSISSLAYILFGQWFFAYKLGWFEISGYEEGFPYFIPYIILPVIIWVILSIGPDVRFFRTIILDEVYQDYVRTARSKGLGENHIMFKHVLKNAMVSIITYVIIQLPFLILGALLLESFFSIPGLGAMTLNAINSSDFPVIRAMTVLSAVAYIIFSILTDVLYTVVDPRVRLH